VDFRQLESVFGERSLLPALGHELRTPLASIRGYIETLLDGEIDPRTARRFLETARREALRLERLIDGMLERSAQDVTGVKGFARCDVTEEICNTIEMIAPLAQPRGVTIRRRLPRRAIVRIDGDLFVHALANLLENAVKHGSERGTIEVSCRRVKAWVEVAVEDDGAGVDPGVRETIFAIGVRGAAAAVRGSGIGLAVVRAIARRAGGDVRVGSSSLGGARFVLRLPAG
jgi:two-component system, OmpR family, phosphate regulon sensor histidine kinase PhoR